LSSSLIVKVCEIEEVVDHPNADRLDLVRVGAWWCITGKGNYAVADKWDITKYCSKVPAVKGDLCQYYRIKAAKLRGIPSFGVMLPLDDPSWEVGFSVVDHYGLKKYEPPENNNIKQGDAAKQPPHFSRYTDMENIKNFPNVFEDGEEVVVTEKIHGMNSRSGYLMTEDGMQFFAGSHNVCRKEFNDAGETTFFWQVLTPNVRDMLEEYSYEVGEVSEREHSPRRNVMLYGEIYGEKVQDMAYGMQGTGFRAFDISINGRYLNYDLFQNICTCYEIDVAPVLYRGPFSLEKMQELVDGPTTLCEPDKAGKFGGREGIVIKPAVERFSPYIGGRVITKMISIDYYERKGVKTESH
jgi:RNA ligase (TIGR02306 family)